MYDIWFYDRDEHSTGVAVVSSMDELYDWFMTNRGYNCSVIITNICEHEKPTEYED